MDKLEQLQPGDILVFIAGDNWISKAIAWLTDSDVSHAAMMLENGRMIEMGASGINAGPVEAHEGDGVILLRLIPEKNPAPLVSSAQRYIDCETRYDFPALVLLAGLIVYRKVRPTQRFVAITDAILRAACKALDHLIQTVVIKNPDKAMVCSQLVYQVYKDCGNEYQIKIDGGILQASTEIDDGCICLADIASGAMSLDLAAALTNAPLPDEEELARELYLALTEQETENDPILAADNLGALPFWTKCFLEKLEEILEKSKSNLPIDALFITPADLAYKATNLNSVGKLNIKRI